MTAMKTQTLLLLTLIKLALIGAALLWLSGCTSMSDVMPKQSLTMEQIYDHPGKIAAKNKSSENSANTFEVTPDNSSGDMQKIRNETKDQIKLSSASKLTENVVSQNTWQSFHKVANPTLKLYVYPHLAGSNELPVPGYTTAFNAYEKEYWKL